MQDKRTKRKPVSLEQSNLMDMMLKRLRANVPLSSEKKIEKLGDRITALQLLVSPFGKTDTASVLSEAVEYIRFLHEQVKALSAPYLYMTPRQLQGNERSSLNAKGLRLMDICNLFAGLDADFASKTKSKNYSFKVASGQQLRKEPAVEIVELPEANELNFSEYVLPPELEDVLHGQKENQQTEDEDVQYDTNEMDSARSATQTKQCSTNAAPYSKKEDVAKKTELGKGKARLHLTLEHLKPHFGKKLKDVAQELGVGRSTIKRSCRYYGIQRWPSNEKYRKNPFLFETDSAKDNCQNSEQSLWPSSRDNLLFSGVPLNQNETQTSTEDDQHLTIQPEPEKLIIKAKYEDDILKFQLSLSSGIYTIMEEVAGRLNLKMGSFKLKYLDEDDDEILLARDDDLQLCLKSLTAAGKTCLQLCVHLIRK